MLLALIVCLLSSSQMQNIDNSLFNGDLQVIQNQQTDSKDKTYWIELANNAWQYYQPGKGVSSSTGLHYAHLTFQGFTDWDLGVYVQAIVDAAKLGIISNEDTWDFDYRIDKVLTFLENRSLAENGVPYTWYNAATGENTDDEPQFAADAGKLLAALKNVELYRPDFTNRVDHIVKTYTNYEPLSQDVEYLIDSVNIYDYYVTRAFAEFWPERFTSKANTILSNIINAPTTEYEGVILPKAKLMCEPLLHSIFEFSPNSDLMDISRTIYLAHEARYNATGNYAAFSEGNPAGIATHYVWEWVVVPDGRTWVTQRDELNDIHMTPIVFLKAAVGLFVLYKTPFTQSMINSMVPRLQTSAGYLEGISETGQTISFTSDKTNGMIIAAARYAIDNNSSTPDSLPPATSPPATDVIPSPHTGTDRPSSPTPNETATLTVPDPPPTTTNESLPSPAPVKPTNTSPPTPVTSTPTSSPTPTTTIDSFWLTQPIIIVVIAIITSILLLFALKRYRKKQLQS